MRKLVIVAIGILALAPAALAGGDKSTSTFADITSINGGSNGFANGTSGGTSKSGGCTIQLAMKGLSGLTDGDNVICTGCADVRAAALGPNPAGNCVVWAIPAKKGSIKTKSSVGIIDVAGQHCGSTQTVSFNAQTTCYKPDLSYDPATACSGGQLWIPAPVNKGFLVGLCQGFTEGARITPPTSGEIARTGQTILLGAK